MRHIDSHKSVSCQPARLGVVTAALLFHSYDLKFKTLLVNARSFVVIVPCRRGVHTRYEESS